MPIPRLIAERWQQRLEQIRREGLWRDLRQPNGAVAWSSNDYLGLSRHPEIVAAFGRNMGSYAGSTGSRLVTGEHPEHTELDRALAQWRRGEAGRGHAHADLAALSFSSGYQQAVAVLPALIERNDVAVCDALNHASLIDGCKLAASRGATVVVYPHRDYAAAARLLNEARSAGSRAVLISDTVFSLDGDVADVAVLSQIAAQAEALLIVDDAHGAGVLGPTGRGAVEAFGVSPDSLVILHAMGKAFGVGGAFVSGPIVLRDLLINVSRGFIFSTAMPPPQAAACRTALQVLQAEGATRRATLTKLCELVDNEARAMGLPIPTTPTPIKPVLVGDAAKAVEVSRKLLDAGHDLRPIRPPAVPPNTARLRLNLTAAHTPDQVHDLLSWLRRVL